MQIVEELVGFLAEIKDPLHIATRHAWKTHTVCTCVWVHARVCVCTCMHALYVYVWVGQPAVVSCGCECERSNIHFWHQFILSRNLRFRQMSHAEYMLAASWPRRGSFSSNKCYKWDQSNLFYFSSSSFHAERNVCLITLESFGTVSSFPVSLDRWRTEEGGGRMW